ncbi:MAG: HPr family phosphocarrier protein [Pseudomonadota bacterium]
MTGSAEATVTIINKRGLHARAAAKVCETAIPFRSQIKVSKDGTSVGARSLMALLMLGAGIGSDVTISAEGDDAEEAVAALKALVEARFHEEE